LSSNSTDDKIIVVKLRQFDDNYHEKRVRDRQKTDLKHFISKTTRMAEQ